MKRGRLIVMFVMATAACADSPKSAPETQPPPPAESTTKSVPADPGLLPTGALLDLESLDLRTESPCSKTIETLRPLLSTLSRHRLKLETLTTQEQAIKELQSLATTLRSSLSKIESRQESPELRRISAELLASIADLAESFENLAAALGKNDQSSAASTMRRIANGISNTQNSVKGLVAQCAS